MLLAIYLNLRVRSSPRPAYATLSSEILPLADTVVAVSQGVRLMILLVQAGLQRERIQVIYNPVVTADL